VADPRRTYAQSLELRRDVRLVRRSPVFRHEHVAILRAPSNQRAVRYAGPKVGCVDADRDLSGEYMFQRPARAGQALIEEKARFAQAALRRSSSNSSAAMICGSGTLYDSDTNSGLSPAWTSSATVAVVIRVPTMQGCPN
jgi:hypothetical protein